MGSNPVGGTILCSCDHISYIDLPDTVQPNSIFPVVVEVTVDSTPNSSVDGACSIMLPVGWAVDGVYYNGASSGTMQPALGLQAGLMIEYPPPDGFTWLSFGSCESYWPDSGDVFNVHMTIHNDSLEGMINLAFHTAWFWNYWGYFNDPVFDSLYVEGLAFTQATWATIKADFAE